MSWTFSGRTRDEISVYPTISEKKTVISSNVSGLTGRPSCSEEGEI